MNKLYDDQLVDEGFLMEVLASHCNVIFQPSFDSPYYSGINPYALGFAIFNDIKRICTEPTREDEFYFPDIVGKNWIEVTRDIMFNYRDDNFIMQFLSPKVMRDFGLFSIERDNNKDYLNVSDIHDDDGFRRIKHALSLNHDINLKIPNLEVIEVDIYGDRQLTIKHDAYNEVLLNDQSVKSTIAHIANIWGFNIEIISIEPVSEKVLKSYFYHKQKEAFFVNSF